jgi:hypothetical protein
MEHASLPAGDVRSPRGRQATGKATRSPRRGDLIAIRAGTVSSPPGWRICTKATRPFPPETARLGAYCASARPVRTSRRMNCPRREGSQRSQCRRKVRPAPLLDREQCPAPVIKTRRGPTVRQSFFVQNDGPTSVDILFLSEARLLSVGGDLDAGHVGFTLWGVQWTGSSSPLTKHHTPRGGYGHRYFMGRGQVEVAVARKWFLSLLQIPDPWTECRYPKKKKKKKGEAKAERSARNSRREPSRASGLPTGAPPVVALVRS